ncbi:S1 family peptidase [Rhodococcus opacus]|uniref:S1 family peptidase n=1 Tax=Rhodococcus opacus TaxID=37919 RepID=UPI002016812A|nr:S1 family peptidase [Rhodococcus opacus]
MGDGTFRALDYAVIRLNPNVVVPSKYSDTSDVIVSTVGDASLSDVGCNHGATTGKNCGIIAKEDGIHLQNWALVWEGDSGGPVVVGERLVGLNIGMDFGIEPPTFYGSITPILADSNAKGSYGAGFTLVQ